MASAINTGIELLGKNNYGKKKIMFILTDGLFEKNEQEKIKNSLKYCLKNGINVIGIGVGVFPIGIDKLFNQVVFAYDPYEVLKGIAYFFGEFIDNTILKDKIDILYNYQNKDELTKNDIKKLINDSKLYPVFKDLRNELDKIEKSIESCDFYFKEIDMMLINNYNLKLPSLYDENILKGQKLLIVMLWTSDISENESKYVNEEYLLKPNINEHYGFFEFQNNLLLKPLLIIMV